MKIKSLLIIISLFSCFLAFGQEKIENSEVYDSYIKSVEKFYGSQISKYKKLSRNPIFRYATDFSLGQGGCIVSVDLDSLGNYILSSHCYTLKSFISKSNKYGIFEHSIKITPEFSNRLKKLFQIAIERIENFEDKRMGLDGTTYYFFSQDQMTNLIGAKIWTPEKKSVIYKINKICQNDLVAISKGHEKKIIKVDKKIKRILNTTQK